MDSAFWGQILSFRVKDNIGVDTDFADKLNYVITSGMFVVATLVLSVRYFCGKVIVCWTPHDFLPHHVEFVENYCWVMSTYQYNMTTNALPDSQDERYSRKLSYYQWIPFLLICCSLMFYCPIILYRIMNWRCGIKVMQIMRLAAEVDMTQDKNDRQGAVVFISRYLREGLCAQLRVKRNCCSKMKSKLASVCLWCGRSHGNYLVILYLFCKCLFLANALAQFFIMFNFLGVEHTFFFGFEFLKAFSSGTGWDEMEAFPREAYCDVRLKRMFNTHRHTVQCLLPINLFAEKIFIFLWFWYFIVVIATAYSMVSWLWFLIWRKNRINFIKRHLGMITEIKKGSKSTKNALEYFVEKELRYDGVFLLRFVAMNCGELVCAEVITQMWKMHRQAIASRSSRIQSDDLSLPGNDNYLNIPDDKRHITKDSSPNSVSDV